MQTLRIFFPLAFRLTGSPDPSLFSDKNGIGIHSKHALIDPLDMLIGLRACLEIGPLSIITQSRLNIVGNY
jgi:hypothetical protein